MLSPTLSDAATRLGLFHTAEEVVIWKQRRLNGPYKTSGDVSNLSPGDWDQRILPRAQAFLANPSSFRYTGGNVTLSGSCVTNTSGTSGPGLQQGREMRDAAFYYLLTGDTAYSTAVRTELLAQVAVSGVDFTNTSKWSHNTGCLTGVVDPSYQLGDWVTRLMLAYDWTKDTFSAGQKTTVETWFSEAATFFQWFHTDNPNGPGKRWPNRSTDTYTSSPMALGSCNSMYFGSPDWCQWHDAWNNLMGVQARTTGLAGILLNNQTMIDHSKRFAREYFAYNVWPDGSIGELQRWLPSNRQHGISYAGTGLANIVYLAEALARNGDDSLYTFTTTSGFNGSNGGPKGMEMVWQRYFEYRDHTITRYASSTTADNVAANIIDGVDDHNNNQQDIKEIAASIANKYYQSNYFKSHYMRTIGGVVPGYGTNIRGGSDQYQGAGGGAGYPFPGVLFMFGQMETLVNPYATADIAPGAPTTLTALDNGPTDMDLSWTAPAETGGGIGGYIIERCTGDDCTNFVEVANQSGVGTTYTDPNLSPATIYNYQVKAYDISSPANVGPASNVAEDDTDAGAPATQRTSQATFQCGYSGAIVGEELKEGPDEECRIVSPSVVRVITGLRNTTGGNPPITSHHLWCQKNAGAWTEIIDTCDSFDLCYSGSDVAITANQVLDEAILPLGGLIYQEGRAKRSIVPPDQLIVEDGKQVEYLHVLHVKDGLIFGDEFGCCERKSGGVELDACVPATLVVGASENRNR